MINQGLSCSQVAFKSNGVSFPILCTTAADTQLLLAKLKTLKNGDYLVVTPPPSKSGQFGLIWGSLPIYVPFDSTAPLNATTLIRDLLVAHPSVCGRDQVTPLLRCDDGSSWTKRQFDTALASSLSRVCTPAERAGLTLHSYRVGLARQLLEAGASPAQMQALLR